jgi:hypothetical protein
MPVYDKVTITVNGIATKVLQGTNSFADLAARASLSGAISGAVTKAVIVAAVQPLTINPNGSYAFVGGETVTLS